MFTSLLVPLDGSPVAAQAIPYVLALAGPLRARVTLLSVLERTADRAVPSEADVRARTLATAYLNAVAAMLRSHGIATSICIRSGDPADIIIRTGKEDDCSLIVMATHGRSGIDRLRLGSVAQRMARYAPMPTLVVPAREHGATEGLATVSDVTAALDGSVFAEQALPAATELADTLHVPLTLLEVLPNYYYDSYGWPGMGYAPPPEQDVANEQAIASYLDAVAIRLHAPARVVRTTWQRSPTDKASNVIRTYLAERPTGIAVMASHGRGGIARWALGSTTEAVIAHPPCAILVVRASAEDDTATPSPAAEADDNIDHVHE